MRKIKVTIEMPDQETAIIETNHTLILASRQEQSQKFNLDYRVLAGANMVDLANMGVAAIEKVLEELNDYPELKIAFIDEIKSILSEEM